MLYKYQAPLPVLSWWFYAKMRLTSQTMRSDTWLHCDCNRNPASWEFKNFKSVSSVQSVKRLLSWSVVCAFSWWCNVSWSVILCGKFEKKVKFLKIAPLTNGHYSYIKLYAFLVILLSHLSPVVVFRWEKKHGELSKWETRLHTCLILYGEKGPPPQGEVIAATGACG